MKFKSLMYLLDIDNPLFGGKKNKFLKLVILTRLN